MEPTLYTLTGNLLWERTLNFNRWNAGATQRAKSDSFQVGGKGINVSRMLVRLGAPTVALCFAGGSTGADCLAWLKSRGIPHQGFQTTQPTRMGVVVRSPEQAETTFLSPDTAPDRGAWQACADFINSLPDGQVLALCGSFPGWATNEAEPARRSISRWASRGHLVVDTYGPPLEWALTQPLALVKINRDEFADLTGLHDRTADLHAALPARLAQSRSSAWVVTDGPADVWLAEQKQALAMSFRPPAVTVVSPTGSGDVLLACLLQAHYLGRMDWAGALRQALPFASANAASAGIAEFDLNKLPG